MSIPPAAKTALLLMAGILAGRMLPIPFDPLWFWPALILLLAFAVIGLTGKGPARGLPVLILLMGWARFSAAQWQPYNHISPLLDGPSVTLKTHLIRDPSCRPESVQFHLSVDSVLARQGFISVKGRCMLTLYDTLENALRYGDEIQLCGELVRPSARRNPGGFDYRAYLTARKTAAILKKDPHTPILKTGKQKGHVFLTTIIYPVRRKITASLESIYNETSEGLMKALILGDRTDLEEDTRSRFSQIGIIHILAVSGLHVGFVLLILQTVFGLIRIPYRWQPVFVIVGLILYTLITESKPPVVRAAMMASLYVAGKNLQRKNNPYNTLGIAALLLLLMNPWMLFDAGFQLSFSAVLSILWLTPRWKRLPGFRTCHQWCSSRSLPGGIWLLFLVSLSAQLGTVPVTATLFNRIPLTGIAANLFAVPLAGLIVAYGFVSLMAAAIHPWLAGIFGGCVEFLIRILVFSAEWTHRFCHAVVYTARPHPLTLLLYLLILLLIFTENPFKKRRLILLGLILINILVWRGAVRVKNGLTWVQLDVGQGDAAVVHLPRGQHFIIDGGDRTPWFDAGQGILIPYLRQHGIRSIDAIIMTHGHNDHVGGLLSVIDEFQVKQVFLSDTLTNSAPFKELIRRIRKRQIPLALVSASDSLCYPGGRCDFLAPDQWMLQDANSNNRSLVTLFTFGRHRFLAMGDAEQEAEARLLETVGPFQCDVLKAGHHGSRTSSSIPFLNSVHPEHAVISVGRNNRFKHPDPCTLENLSRMGIPYYRTDIEGAVIFYSDGTRLEKIDWKQ